MLKSRVRTHTAECQVFGLSDRLNTEAAAGGAGVREAGMIYLVHFQRPYKHAKHYLGFTELTLTERFARHCSNAKKRRGSALMNAIFMAGIKFKVVRTWEGDRTRERQLKNSGHSIRCPVCRGTVTYAAARDLLAAENEP